MTHSQLVQTARRIRYLIRLCIGSLLSFLVGALLYYGIELAVRGWSHWTMAICGGLCLMGIYHVNRLLRRHSILLRALCGALIITAVEFVAGCILNLWLGLNIWNYGIHTLNLLGQICPYMSFFWFLLSIPACWISSVIHKILCPKSFFKTLSRAVSRDAVHHTQQDISSQQGRTAAGHERQRQTDDRQEGEAHA